MDMQVVTRKEMTQIYSPRDTQVGSGNQFDLSLIQSFSFSSSSVTNTYTDHGAVEKSLQAVQKALEGMRDVSVAAVESSELIAAKSLETSRAQFKELRKVVETALQQANESSRESRFRELEAQRAIWEILMLPNLPREAVIQIAQQMQQNISRSLQSIEETRRKEQELQKAKAEEQAARNQCRIANIVLAEREIQKITSRLSDQESLIKTSLIFSCFLPMLFFCSDARTGIYATLFWCGVVVTVISNLSKEQLQKKSVIFTYQLALQNLKKNPELTLREAVRHQPHIPSVLRNIPDVAVPDTLQTELPQELRTFIQVVRNAISLEKA